MLVKKFVKLYMPQGRLVGKPTARLLHDTLQSDNARFRLLAFFGALLCARGIALRMLKRCVGHSAYRLVRPDRLPTDPRRV